MTATNHALTGALVATVVNQPVLALPLAFLSHFVSDALPHFGVDLPFGSRRMYSWLLIDGLSAIVAAGLLLLLGVDQPLLLATGGFLAMSPDLAWLYYGLRHGRGSLHHKLHRYDLLNRFHAWIQWYEKPAGLLVEVLWAALMISLIISLQP